MIRVGPLFTNSEKGEVSRGSVGRYPEEWNSRDDEVLAKGRGFVSGFWAISEKYCNKNDEIFTSKSDRFPLLMLDRKTTQNMRRNMEFYA